VGFITNQRLKGEVQRNRGHRPINAVFALGNGSTDKWNATHKIVAEIVATCKSGDYQCFYFSKADLKKLVPSLAIASGRETMRDLVMDLLHGVDDANTLSSLVQSVSAQLRRKIAMDVLHGLDDADLLSFLSELLQSRSSTRV
jgi:hypothetical protein